MEVEIVCKNVESIFKEGDTVSLFLNKQKRR